MTDEVGRSPESFEGNDSSPAAALNSFLRVIARHRVLFAAVVILCLLGAGAWLAHRTPSYRATAEILVSPIPATDETLVGLPLIRASQLEPQRAAATAAPLLDSSAAARRAATELDENAGAVSSAVTVEAVPDSSLVRVTAEGSSANGSAAVANAYAEAALVVRDRYLAPKVRAAIRTTEEQLESVSNPGGAEANALAARLAALRSIARRGDPTLALGRRAEPGTPQNTPPSQVLLVALLAGILLAGLTVVMIELLVAQPINTEAELLRLYPLPVLARVPEDDLDSGARFRRPFGDAPPSVREGFRALRDQLELRASSASSRPTGEWGPTVLMVSPERSDARSACTLDLARAFSSIHDSATVLELDVRNPRMAGMLAVDPPGDLSSLLSGGSVGAVGVPFDGAGSRLVAAPPVVDLATHEAITARSASIVAEARQRDGWVVVDAPPITEATADAVAALQAADHVVVIVHLGSTRPEGLSLLREVFEQRGRRPDGYLVVSGNLVRERRSASPS